jgi:hypothetical protein
VRRIDLPGGHWADIKAPDEISNRDRKTLRRHAMAARGVAEKLADAGLLAPGQDPTSLDEATQAKIGRLIDADDLDLTDAAQSAIIVAYVAAWDLGDLPTMDTVDDLPGPVFDRLAMVTAGLGDGTLDASPDGALDPGSPTVPSPA